MINFNLLTDKKSFLIWITLSRSASAGRDLPRAKNTVARL